MFSSYTRGTTQHPGAHAALFAARPIDWAFALARKYDLRLKLTLEHFRHFGDDSPSWAAKQLHAKSNGGTAETTAVLLDGQLSRELLKKIEISQRNRIPKQRNDVQTRRRQDDANEY